MTRAFVAIRPPESVLDAVAARTAAVEIRDGRRTPREQWHVTVQFFGDVDLDAVAAALDVMSMPAFEVQLSGAGTLPRKRRAKYLVLFLAAGLGELGAVADTVAARVAPLGIEREARAFTPHLTIARLREARDLKAECAAIGEAPVGPAWPVGELVLFESRLSSEGAEHLVRAVIPLGP